MINYLKLMRLIMETGVDREGRNGTTRALFAQQLRWNLQEGFPAVTTKKFAFKGVIGELLWFLSGSTNNFDLAEASGKSPGDRTIWSDNADDYAKKGKAGSEGDLGRIYGKQWRCFRTFRHPEFEPAPEGSFISEEFGSTDDGSEIVTIEVDQIKRLVEGLRKNPYSRYHVVTAWNPGDMDAMALPACHVLFQCFVANGKLSLHMVQRSCDYVIGVPFNIASYALLTHMLAQVTGLQVGELVITFNDVHIYHEHFAAMETQLAREPYAAPTLQLNPARQELEQFTLGDFTLHGYESHPKIEARMIV